MKRRLSVSAGCVLVALLVAAAPAPPLRAMRWLATAADPVKELTTRPAECLASPADPAARAAVEIGRAAFASPLLLGGQAARAGLSCDSCHRAGRGNPAFRFPGISGAAGTADVTASLFSTRRGDGIDNPVLIPDLAGPPEQLKRARDPALLRSFIRGLIVEEFDGAEPPPAVLAGLTAYVRALSPAACPATRHEAVRVSDAVADADRAVMAAQQALAGGDRATAAAMLLAARGQLGLIDERFAGSALAAGRAALRAQDDDLRAILTAVRAADAGASDGIVRWHRGVPALAARLNRHAARSLFDPGTLAAALRRDAERQP